MPFIEIDDDLHSFLQCNALTLLETPNSTLKRLLDVSICERPELEVVDTSLISYGEFRFVLGEVPHQNTFN